jgi:uncharacterized protein
MQRLLIPSLLLVAFNAHADPALIAQARGRLDMAAVKANADSLVQYAALGDTSTVALLLAAGVPASAVEPTRLVTALHNAAAQGQLPVIELLLGRGADANAQDWRGVTPLINAAHGGHVVAVEKLLKAGARVDACPSQGPTALLAAVQAQRPSVVRLLLKAGASPAQADVFGTTPEVAAQMAGRAAIAQLLKDRS